MPVRYMLNLDVESGSGSGSLTLRGGAEPPRSGAATASDSGASGLAVVSFRFVVSCMLLLVMWTAPAVGQTMPLAVEFDAPGVTGYDEAIPTPEDVLGYRIGTRHTAPHEAVRYFEELARLSDRITLQVHARSYEGRRLVHAIVTAPEHHARLESIRQANVRLSDEPRAVTDAALADQPAVVYMGYSVHGNEASGTEAAMLLLYHLAAGDGPAIDDVLNHTVVLVDPLFNPDGRDRFVDWANRHRGGVHTTDPQDREHNETWPGGRTNHYWFDLNRDWLPAQHPESQGRLATFHHWRPQVLTDYHEMGKEATYFFQPGVPSRTNPTTPEENQELTGRIAEHHAAILDDIGSLYYTRETYDDFYYGKGSTYPDLNGAVGILFEQASSRALESETMDGNLHYAFTVRNQIATSLSTLAAVVEMREELLHYQRDFYANAGAVAREADVKAYVVALNERRTRAQALAQVLRQHRVQMYELARPYDDGARTFRPGEAYVVPVDQPQARLVKAFMERTTSFPDSLFYDVSTWTLPLAFDVPYAEVHEDADRYTGAAWEGADYDGGAVVGGRSDYAYVLEWERYLAPRALYRFQDAGVGARLFTKPFTAVVDGRERSFDRGSVVLPVSSGGEQNDTVHALAERAAAEDHVRIYAVDSGLTPDGPDLGSRGAVVLQRPTVALLVGDGTRAYDAGEVWHLLTERFRMPVSLLDVQALVEMDLSRYNTLVMVDGTYDTSVAEEVRGWVERGGHLVALGGADEWVVDSGLVDLTERSEVDMDSLLRGRPYAELERARGAQYLGGTVFETELDVTHPIGYGLDDDLPVFRRGTTFFEPSAEAGATVARFAQAPLLSGYVSEEVLPSVSGAAAVTAIRHGRGRVTSMAFNPNFRAFWYGTNSVFLNAIFFGGAF